jgi:site-specific recombinase XerD
MLLSCFFETHYLPYNPSTASKTIKLYQHSFRMFGLWLGHAATLDDLQNEIVGKYLSHLFRSELKPASVNKERSQLLAIWNHAHKLGMVRLGPLVKPVKAPETIPTSLTVDDLRQLCNSFDKLLGSTRGVENRLLIRAAFLLQYVTAERIGAIVQLQWSDIQGQQIAFRAETSEMRNSLDCSNSSRLCDCGTECNQDCQILVRVSRTENQQATFALRPAFQTCWNRQAKREVQPPIEIHTCHVFESCWWRCNRVTGSSIQRNNSQKLHRPTINADGILEADP